MQHCCALSHDDGIVIAAVDVLAEQIDERKLGVLPAPRTTQVPGDQLTEAQAFIRLARQNEAPVRRDARSSIEYRSRSQRVDLKYVRVIARRAFRQSYGDSVRVTRPHEIGLRPQQSDSGDFAAVMGRIRSERLDHQSPVFGPSQRYRV